MKLKDAISQLGIEAGDTVWVISDSKKTRTKAMPQVRELEKNTLESECLEIKKTSGLFCFRIG